MTTLLTPAQESINSREEVWLQGPLFLRSIPTAWPQLTIPLDSTVFVGVVQEPDPGEELLNYGRYSSFLQARRIMAYILRACDAFKAERRNLRSQSKRKRDIHSLPTDTKIGLIPCLTATEIKKGEITMVKQAQRTCYKEDISLLSQNSPLPKSSRLHPLSAMIDQDGLVRLNGRISQAIWLPYDSRYPPILPRESPLSALIVRHFHERFYHQNQAAVAAAVRCRFWITDIGRLLCGTKARCQYCKNIAARPQQPKMGQLPPERVTPYIRPFTYTGVDLAGTYLVNIGRRQEKRWIVLFTCMTVRAIHL